MAKYKVGEEVIYNQCNKSTDYKVKPMKVKVLSIIAPQRVISHRGLISFEPCYEIELGGRRRVAQDMLAKRR